MDSLGRQSSWMNAWWRETVSSYDSEEDALDYAPISGGFSKLDTQHLNVENTFIQHDNNTSAEEWMK